jgi:sulfur relay protein TusB/DsrH
MLYILNKTSEESLKQLAVISGADDDKSVLFVTDAVFWATEANLKRFASLKVENFYAAKDAVEARVMQAADAVELVDYEDMAELLEDADKVVVL